MHRWTTSRRKSSKSRSEESIKLNDAYYEKKRILYEVLDLLADLKSDETRAEVQRRIDADRTTPKTLEELRADGAEANRLRGTADRALKLGSVDEAIKPFIRTIQEIIKNTTAAGKEAASVGDRTTEAAAEQEVETGKPVKKWHGPKCAMESTGLARAIAGSVSSSLVKAEMGVLGFAAAAARTSG